MKRILRELGLFAIGVVFTLILSLFIIDAVIMPYIVDVKKVRVPDLKGMDEEKALNRLERLGLRLVASDSLYHEHIPHRAVVDQTPAARQQIKKGRRIFVDLSLGPRLYAVPNITQVSLREARLQLESSQLRVGNIIYQSSSLPKGAIIEQNPPTAVRLPRHNTVHLTISNGPADQPKLVPSLLRLPIEVVEDTLRKYEMRLGLIENRIDTTVPLGTVLEQYPQAAAQAKRLTPIDLVLSAFPEFDETTLENLPEN